jgi:hypothetical protein
MKRTLMLLTAAVVVVPSMAAASQSQNYGQSAPQAQPASPIQGANAAQGKDADAAANSNQTTATCASPGKSSDSKSRAPATGVRPESVRAITRDTGDLPPPRKKNETAKDSCASQPQ